MIEVLFSDPFCLFLVVKLDDWVLCKIYKKIKKPNDVRNRQRDGDSSTVSAINDSDSVNHYGEVRTDLPVMDSGHAREIDNGGADAVFADDYSQQEIASSEFPADFNLHVASYSSMFPRWPRLVEILPQYFPILTTCQPKMSF